MTQSNRHGFNRANFSLLAQVFTFYEFKISIIKRSFGQLLINENEFQRIIY